MKHKKKRLWFDTLIFVVNSLLAFLLLLSYLLPYIPPKHFPILSVLSLGVPVLITINIVFLLYWIFRMKRELLLSGIVLLLGVQHITAFYRIGKSSDATDKNSNLRVMSYNVHHFNLFRWIGNKNVPLELSRFVRKQNPDIVCLQEYTKSEDVNFDTFPYQFINYIYDNGEIGQAILSKYPIHNSGEIAFDNSLNSVIYTDIHAPGDTIRVYNVHLQSHRINANRHILQKEGSEKLLKRIGASFEKQQYQMEKLLEHMKTSPYPMLVMGDFNNTAFSYVYAQITKSNLLDAYKEAGRGFGKTYNFKFFPTRIDFILTDSKFSVNDFTTFPVHLSDHYPVQADLSW